MKERKKKEDVKIFRPSIQDRMAINKDGKNFKKSRLWGKAEVYFQADLIGK